MEIYLVITNSNIFTTFISEINFALQSSHSLSLMQIVIAAGIELPDSKFIFLF